MRWTLAVIVLQLFCFDSWAASQACKASWRRFDPKNDRSYSEYQKSTHRVACQKDWTVLVYMAADNNLGPYAYWDLYEMEAGFVNSPDSVGSTSRTDVVVQLDSPGPQGIKRLHIFQDSLVYKKQTLSSFSNWSDKNIRSPVVANLSEDSKRSQAQLLEDFLAWGARNYPAKNYLVIVWGHGQGWKAHPKDIKAVMSHTLREQDLDFGLLRSTPKKTAASEWGGLGLSAKTDDVLSIPDLHKALKSFSLEIGKPVDVYASDACLMQMAEVAYELNDVTRFVVGSTQVQNYLGFPYRRLFYELNHGGFDKERALKRNSVDATDEAYLLARMLPRLLKESMNPRSGLQGRSDGEGAKFITSSSVSSAAFEQSLIPELKRLSAALVAYIREDKARSLDLLFITQRVPAFEGSAQDLAIFLGALELQLQEEGRVTPAAAALKQSIISTKKALDMSIVQYAFGSAYAIDGNSKLTGFVPRAFSIWLPVSQEDWLARRAEFASSRFYQKTLWGNWLKLLFP